MFIVTGGTSGIGLATVQALASREQSVLAAGRNVDRLQSLGDQYPDRVKVVRADLSTTSGLDSLCSAVNSVDRISGIVHAAGSAVPLADYQKLEQADLLFDFALHVALPITLNNRLSSRLAGARILYLDSYSANSPRVGWAGYSIVKSAAQMAARAAAAELSNSTVIRVFPGAVRTPLVEAVLTSTHACQTADVFRAMDTNGKISEAGEIGEYLANLLLDAREDQLAAREYWDFGVPESRIF